MAQKPKKKRILAIASGGGHWIQLLRTRPAFEDLDTAYATTIPKMRESVLADARARGLPEPRFFVCRDANRNEKVKLLLQFLDIFLILLRVRPHVVLTTGASPGFFALVLGKLLGARTIWLDSIANPEEMSMSGQQARRFADLWLTQWPQLATENGPNHVGSVL